MTTILMRASDVALAAETAFNALDKKISSGLMGEKIIEMGKQRRRVETIRAMAAYAQEETNNYVAVDADDFALLRDWGDL